MPSFYARQKVVPSFAFVLMSDDVFWIKKKERKKRFFGQFESTAFSTAFVRSVCVGIFLFQDLFLFDNE